MKIKYSKKLILIKYYKDFFLKLKMNSTELEIECLKKMAIALDEKCSQNKKDIATIFDLIDDIRNKANISDSKANISDSKANISDSKANNEEITLDEKLEAIEDGMTDTTIDRRIAFHKENNTYKEPEEPKISTITPLHTLTNADREALEKKIFYDAIFNVEKLLGIKRDDPDFRNKVCEESDRLLDLWNEQHRTKKY
jgi:hypothetical protein